MAWYDPTTWNAKRVALGVATGGMSEGGGLVPALSRAAKLGQRAPEMYDPDSPNAKRAREYGPRSREYDITGEQAAGTQLDVTQANEARAGQMGLSQTLNEAIAGRGPSAAGFAAQGQQRAALANAAALTAGARGRSAVGGMIAGNAAASQGVQQAAQNEALGRMQEMAQARGEQGNLLGNIRAADIGVAGQNAQLGQNAAQYNASQRQAAQAANQAAALQIARDELAARQHQGDMEFTNLDPGSEGYLHDIAAAGGTIAKSAMAHGGVVDSSRGIPRYAEGGVIGIGQRRTPISKGDLDVGREIAKSIVSFIGAFQAGTPGAPAAPTTPMPGATTSAPSAPPMLAQPSMAAAPTQYPTAMAQTLTPPSYVPMAMARGGAVRGPQTALVGEAGPEAIIDIKGIVDRPTIARLGSQGRPQAVIPLSKGQDGDRKRVLRDIVALCGGGR